MFRKPAILLLLLCLLTLAACDRVKPSQNLSHQRYPLDAVGTLIYDGEEYEVALSIRKAGDLLLQVIRPEALAGTVFELRDGQVLISCGGLTETWEDGDYAVNQGILLTARMFSLSGKDYSGAGVITTDGERYSYATYTAEGGTVTLYFADKSSFPHHIRAELAGHSLILRFVNDT